MGVQQPQTIVCFDVSASSFQIHLWSDFKQSISLTCSDMYVQSLWYLVMFRHVHSLSLLVETTT